MLGEPCTQATRQAAHNAPKCSNRNTSVSMQGRLHAACLIFRDSHFLWQIQTDVSPKLIEGDKFKVCWECILGSKGVLCCLSLSMLAHPLYVNSRRDALPRCGMDSCMPFLPACPFLRMRSGIFPCDPK